MYNSYNEGEGDSMWIELELQSDVPIYSQIRNQVIEGMATQALKPGDELPSIRMLASDLGVNMHTVNKAYNLLKQEGFIETHRQKGVVVHPDSFPADDPSFREKLKGSLRPLIAEGICRGMDERAFDKLCHELFADMKKSLQR